jgi:type VI secretion system protein
MKFEPRIKDVRVEFSEQREDVLSLRFKISGRFDLENKNTPVVFESVVQSDGKISVSS